MKKTGIDSNKISTIPLAYTPPDETKSFKRAYPNSFSQERPLKVLFLGQIVLRKGVARVFEAIKNLENYPMEFIFVGPIDIFIPREIRNSSKVKFLGSVSRSSTAKYYKQADVFLFPTLSDGFGLTQLEAQAWQLPLISSQYCGSVVEDKINGLKLLEVTSENITNALLFCFSNPQILYKYSRNSIRNLECYSLSRIGKELQNLN